VECCVSHDLPFAPVSTEALLPLFLCLVSLKQGLLISCQRRTSIGNPLGSQRRRHCSIGGRAQAAKISRVLSKRCGRRFNGFQNTTNRWFGQAFFLSSSGLCYDKLLRSHVTVEQDCERLEWVSWDKYFGTKSSYVILSKVSDMSVCSVRDCSRFVSTRDKIFLTDVAFFRFVNGNQYAAKEVSS
jgi:hypothetical protein